MNDAQEEAIEKGIPYVRDITPLKVEKPKVKKIKVVEKPKVKEKK